MKIRNPTIDLIRITATLMIVLAHIVATVYGRPDWFGGTAWWLSFVIITLGRLGVPLFFMMSGYLLANKQRSMNENFSHTWRRIIAPLLVWTGITYIAQYYSGSHALTLKTDLLWVAAGTPFYFLIGLAVLYLINPLIQNLVKLAGRKELELMLLILMVSTIGQTFYANAKELAGFSIFSYWWLALPYFLYGHYYFKFNSKANKLGKIWWLFLLSTGLILWLVYEARVVGNWHDLVWESYFGPTVMAASLGLFRGLMRLSVVQWQDRVKRWLAVLADACFGIYLSHWLVLDLLLHKTTLNPFSGQPINLLFFLGMATIITISVSLGISLLVGKLSWGKVVLGLKV